MLDFRKRKVPNFFYQPMYVRNNFNKGIKNTTKRKRRDAGFLLFSFSTSRARHNGSRWPSDLSAKYFYFHLFSLISKPLFKSSYPSCCSWYDAARVNKRQTRGDNFRCRMMEWCFLKMRPQIRFVNNKMYAFIRRLWNSVGKNSFKNWSIVLNYHSYFSSRKISTRWQW